jgi:CelD/BcsL family acetyltransferase involved in cellulose biosynthesis
MQFGEIFSDPQVRRPSSVSAVATGAAAARLTVETVVDNRSFFDLVGDWNRLVEEANIEHPFLTHEWVRTWWECFGAGKKLHVLVVKAGDRPIAIAPFMLSIGRMYGIKMRKLEFIANVHTPRCDFIVADGARDAYRAIWDNLASHAGLWDVIELTQVLFDSPTLKELPPLAAKGGFLTGTWHSEDCPCVDLSRGWTELARGLSHNHRSQMGKRLRRLRQIAPVRLEILSNPNNLQEVVGEGFEIEADAWKRRTGTAILCRPELVSFYRQIAEEASTLGMLRLIFLTVGDTRIAFAYGLFYKNKIYVLKAGYRPSYGRFSPYLLLCHLLFQQACDEGVSEYEFLGGSDAWKLHWADKTKPQCWFYIFPRKMRGSLVHSVKFGALPTLGLRQLYSLIRWPIEPRRRPITQNVTDL